MSADRSIYGLLGISGYQRAIMRAMFWRGFGMGFTVNLILAVAAFIIGRTT